MTDKDLLILILLFGIGTRLCEWFGRVTAIFLRRHLTAGQFHLAVVAILVAVVVAIALMPGVPLEFSTTTK